MLEYRVVAKFDYPRLIYEIVFPRGQKFPNTTDLGNMGRDPIRKVAELHLAAEFGVNGKDRRDQPPDENLWDEHAVRGEKFNSTLTKSTMHAHIRRKRHTSGLIEELRQNSKRRTLPITL